MVGTCSCLTKTQLASLPRHSALIVVSEMPQVELLKMKRLLS